MKLKTHYIFSTGLLALINSLLMHDVYVSLIFAAIISVISNAIIDKAGHEIKGRYIARTPTTHTLPRSVLWGLIPAVIIILAASYLTYTGEYYSFSPLQLAPIALDGIVVGPSHMLLDVFTEKGIYVKKNGRWVRFALAHLRFNDPIANGLAIVAGALMLFVALGL